MGMSAVQYKIMPKDLNTNLEEIEKKVKKIIEENSGVFGSSTKEPIAFGLKSLIISFAYPEKKEIDELENKINKIEGVSSCELIDYRRAFG